MLQPHEKVTVLARLLHSMKTKVMNKIHDYQKYATKIYAYICSYLILTINMENFHRRRAHTKIVRQEINAIYRHK